MAAKGDTVTWRWGNGTAEGKVETVYPRKVTRKLKGASVSRNGTKDDPALFIKQQDGDGVLKLASEVEVK